MGCLKSGCKGSVIDSARHWGFAVDICQSHFHEEIGKISEKVPGKLQDVVADTFLQDYAKISLLLEHKPTVQDRLKRLAATWRSTLADAKKGVENSGEYVKLSTLLAKYERMCWFPASHDIFLGFLETADFDGSIARGIMAKDPGASVNHGDFTHRLQWHVIMSVVTNEFSTAKLPGWNHTPLHLYTTCGRAPYDGKNNVWFRLFDNNSQKDFRSPDWTNHHVATGDYGPISAAVAKRHLKRLREYLQYDAAPVLASASSLNVAKSKNYESAFNEFRAGYAKRKTAAPKEGRTIEGVKMMAPWSGKGGENIESMEMSARITASYGGLNYLQNRHDPRLGPIPSPGKDDSVSRFSTLFV